MNCTIPNYEAIIYAINYYNNNSYLPIDMLSSNQYDDNHLGTYFIIFTVSTFRKRD